MAMHALAGAAKVSAPPVVETGKQSFSQVLKSSPAQPSALRLEGPRMASPTPVKPARVHAAGHRISGASQAAKPATTSIRGVAQAASAIDRVNLAQSRLDRVLKLAASGKTFTPAELLALQAHVAQASQELDLAGKVVEKATSGVKQLLSTQV